MVISNGRRSIINSSFYDLIERMVKINCAIVCLSIREFQGVLERFRRQKIKEEGGFNKI